MSVSGRCSCSWQLDGNKTVGGSQRKGRTLYHRDCDICHREEKTAKIVGLLDTQSRVYD